MNINKLFLYLFLLIFIYNDKANGFHIPIISDIQEIIGLGHDIAGLISGDIPFGSFFGLGGDDNKDEEILDKLDGISNQLAELTSQVNEQLDNVLKTIVARIPLSNQINIQMNELHHITTRVDGLYNKLMHYISFHKNAKKKVSVNKKTLKKFANSVIADKQGDLSDVLENLHRLIVPGRSKGFRSGLLELLIKQRNISDPIEKCGEDISFQQRLYEMFNVIVVTEIRAHVLLAVSYSLLARFDKEDYDGERSESEAQMVLRSLDYMMAFKNALAQSSRAMYHCDPMSENYILGKNYFEFKDLFDSKKKGKYAISLRPQLADIKNNFVIIDVKLYVDKNVLGIQISTGKLYPRGTVNQFTKNWVSEEIFVVEDKNYFFNDWKNGRKIGMKENTDYVILSPTRKTFDLDYYFTQKDYIITGIKFAVDEKTGHIGFKIHATPFDFDTGKLLPTKSKPSIWVDSKNSAPQENPRITQWAYNNHARTELELPDIDASTKVNTNIQDSTYNQYINLRKTEQKRDKEGHVVPMIDLQRAGSNHGLALNGVAMYHRGSKGYGGFLAFKLFIVDVRSALKTGITKKQFESYDDYYAEELGYEPKFTS